MVACIAKTVTSHATPRRYLPKRFLVVFLGFLGVLINYIIRGDLSVAMVAMVNHTRTSSVANHSSSSSECLVTLVTENVTEKVFKGDCYNWDSVTQGYIMSAFFYCYFAFVLIGGYVAERRMFGVAILFSSVLSFFIPLAARYGIIPLIIVRSLQGICGGVTQPAMCSVVSKWSPKLERSFIMTIIFTGTIMSSVIANPISGWLATLEFMGGWPAIFYISGIAGCVWYILWFIFVYESPRVHPSITKDELRHFDIEEDNIIRKRPDVPWKDIFTSLPFWSVFFSSFGSTFTFNILFTELPTYLSTVLHFNIKNSGLLSTLPFLAESISAWITSFVADKARKSGRWSITTIRKSFNSLSGYVLSVCLLGITFSGCNSSLIIGLLTFGMFIDGFKYSGFHANVIDLSPEFAGTLYGLQYGTTSLFAALGPVMVGALTLSGATAKNWSKVFYVTAAIKFIVTTFYVTFASSERQLWGKEKEEKKTAADESKI